MGRAPAMYTLEIAGSNPVQGSSAFFFEIIVADSFERCFEYMYIQVQISYHSYTHVYTSLYKTNVDFIVLTYSSARGELL